jgi:hypothetical protein
VDEENLAVICGNAAVAPLVFEPAHGSETPHAEQVWAAKVEVAGHVGVEWTIPAHRLPESSTRKSGVVGGS